MKILWKQILLTILLYILLITAFLIADHFSYRGGANDMGNGLLVFAIGAIVIAVFFIQSIYRALRLSKDYWQITILHLILAVCFARYFMF